MQQYETSQAFKLLKDHKPNFETDLPCRLINPATSDIGRISKVILEQTTATIRPNTPVNQWRSTGEVITWFCETCIPARTRFLTFDIESFYPSISENLPDKAIGFAQCRSDLSPEDIELIKHYHKSLLFDLQG